MTDIELLEEYKEGNTEAFHEFYTRYQDSLYTFLRNRRVVIISILMVVLCLNQNNFIDGKKPILNFNK